MRLKPHDNLTDTPTKKGYKVKNHKPTKLDILGACVMGAVIGAMLAVAVLGGF